MKAEHTVKINGEWYRAGSEIPAHNNAAVEQKQETVEPIAISNNAETVEPVVAESDEAKAEKLTRSKITLMNVAGLRELGKQNGVENVDELTGSELKEILINKLGL